MDKLLNQPLGVLWRTALVRTPRLVPDFVLRWTSPGGPQPFVIQLPSRGRYTIPVYIFIPDDITRAEARKLPVVLDFHGGGFFLGSCLEQAPFCAQAARELRAVVITVDYRMGPVDQFPAAVEDAEDVLSAVVDEGARGARELRRAVVRRIRALWKEDGGNPEGEEAEREGSKTPDTRNDSNNNTSLPSPSPIALDPTRLAISGFSSGGNLALNLALSIHPPQQGAPWPTKIPQDDAHPLPLLLYYPSFDSRLLPSERTRPPHLPVGSSFWADVSDTLHPTYLPREQASHPRASPGLAAVANGGLHARARMLLVLPELDTLAEQSEVWVRKVVDEGRGADLRVQRFPRMKHGWTQMPDGMLETEEERGSKREIHDRAMEFVRAVWEGEGMVAAA